jgi:hypothetical protein
LPKSNLRRLDTFLTRLRNDRHLSTLDLIPFEAKILEICAVEKAECFVR